MPILPPASTVPFDSVDYVLREARIICNDAGLSISGNLLAISQPYTLTLINMAYRTLQEDLTVNGVEYMAKEAILLNITPVPGAITDPGIQPYVGYDVFFDGLNQNTSPLLPQDMCGPLVLGERTNGSNALFTPMHPVNDGLPSRSRTASLGQWEWRDQARIYFVGATLARDVKLRYNVYLPELVASGDPVQILRCDRALAYLISNIFADARGSALADKFYDKYVLYLTRMCSATARRKQRGRHRRIGFSRGRHSGWGA
jgi:hypothetical protein